MNPTHYIIIVLVKLYVIVPAVLLLSFRIVLFFTGVTDLLASVLIGCDC